VSGKSSIEKFSACFYDTCRSRIFREGFRMAKVAPVRAFLAGAAGLNFALGAIVPAQADDAHVIGTSPPDSRAYVANADNAAENWSRNHLGTVAVAVSIGAQSSAKPEKILEIVGAGLKKAGVDDVVFFFDNGEGPSTVLTLSYKGMVVNTPANHGGIFNLTDGPKGIMGSLDDIADSIESMDRYQRMYEDLYR
jgi:hypothetical protein